VLCWARYFILRVSLSAKVYRIVSAVMDNHLLRLLFTSDRVVVRVVIRGTELYDLVKINVIYGVGSRRWKNKANTILDLGLVIGWFFCFCFQLLQSHCIIRNRVKMEYP